MVNLYQIDHGFFAAFAQWSPGPRRGVTSCLWFNALTCACFFLVGQWNGFSRKIYWFKPHDLNGKIYGFRFQFSLKPIQSVCGAITILKNDGLREWEGLSHI